MPEFILAMYCYEDKDNRLLFVEDESGHEIRILDINSRTEINPIPVRDTGINAIPYHWGFVVKNPDSIYFPVGNHKLYCINRNGDIVNIFDFSSIVKKYPLFTTPISGSRYTKGAIVLGNYIFFLQHDNRKYYFAKKPSDYHFLLRYGIKDNSFEIFPISMPDDFWREGKRQMSILLTYNDLEKKFVFGTQYGDLIFTSKDGATITKIYHSKSKSIIEAYYPYTPPDNLNAQRYIFSVCKFSLNGGLLWDPAKKIYYRFVWPGMKDLDSNQASRINKIYDHFPTFTIDILDQNFNALGSYQLPNGKYNWNNYFLSKDGLYLAVNRPEKSGKDNHWSWVFHVLKTQNIQ
jgi:hypothetical protein